MQILRIHEVEFMKRVLNDPTNHWGEKQAKSFYDSLWKKLIDARTRERTNNDQRLKLYLEIKSISTQKLIW